MKKLSLFICICISVLYNLKADALVTTADEINLIKNGHFDNQTLGIPDSWGFWSQNGRVAPIVVDGAVMCSPIASPNVWEYLLNQTGMNALPNIPYIFSFKAWSPVNRSIAVTFQDTQENNFNPYGSSSDPEANYGSSSWSVNITPTPTTYTFHVVFDKMVPSTVQYLQFMLNATSDVVYIDDVSLARVEDLSGIKVSLNSAILTASEGSATKLLVTTTASWTANSDQSWLTVSPNSGSGNETLVLTANANTSILNRTANVTITADGFSEPQIITITQQGSKTPFTVTAGGLASLFSQDELATLTKLTLTGTIDARDFKTMRDDMPMLAEIDLSEVNIVEYSGNEGTSNLSNINYPANAIPEFAFLNSNWQGKESLTSINLPLSIVSVETWAFGNCQNLSAISLPPMVKYIRENAFISCVGLKDIFISSSVELIESQSFYFCSGYITVDQNNMNYSGKDGILFNKDQTTLIQCTISKEGDYIVPSTVASIGGSAFKYCNKITSLVIPPSVTLIGDRAFGFTNCTITVDGNNPSYTCIENILYDKLITRLTWCSQTNSGEFSIPNTVTEIAAAALESCTLLTSIKIPSSVSSIGYGAFWNCSGLNSIFTYKNSPSEILLGSEVFYSIDQTICKLYVPYGKSGLYSIADQWKDFTNIVEMPGFSLSETSINIAATEGSTVNVNIKANMAWAASSDQAWLIVSPASQSTDATLTFTAEANTSIGTRKATVTVSASGVESQTITVTQAGSNALIAVTAGNLINLFSAEELATITKLTLTGTIDARDFKTMRDDMPMLAEIDLSGVNISAYTGTEGTASTSNTLYSANVIPQYAFLHPDTFVGKTSLISFKFPSTVISIGDYAFFRCNGIVGIDFSPSISSVGQSAFYDTGLTSLNIPSSITSIANQSFSYCSKLESITIPSSLVNIGLYAFDSSDGLINVDSNNPNYSSLDGIMFNKQKTDIIHCPISKSGTYTVPVTVISIGATAFSNCKLLTSVIIPSSVTSIGYNAFFRCTSLVSATIPSSVNRIINQAFRDCTDLISIYSNRFTPLDLSSMIDVFGNVNKTNCTLYVPYGSKTAYQAANQWKDFTNIVEAANGFNLNASAVSIAATAGSTANVNLKANLAWAASSDQAWLTVSPASQSTDATLTFTAEANTSIGTRKATVTVSASGVESQTVIVTQSGSNAPIAVTAGNLIKLFSTEEFASITKLTLTGTIDARDFKTMRDDMPLLAEIDLSGVTIVAYTGTEGPSLWGNTNYLANAVPDFAFSIGDWTGQTRLTSIILPASTTSFGAYAFGSCRGLTEMTIPQFVTTIGIDAYFNCSGFTSINIPPSVTSINGSFRYFTGLINVAEANPNYSSLDGVLFNKTQTLLIACPISKTGIYTIPSSVISIKQSAFESCNSLSSLTIPSSVKSIEYAAFWACTGLSSINVYKSNPEEINLGSDVFNYVDKNTCTLYVPYGSKTAYQAANQWQDFTNIVEAANGFNLSASAVSLDAAAGSNTTIDLTANVAWTASSDQPWLTVDPGTATGNNTLTFTAEANPSTIDSRVAVVTISADGIPSQTITVTQEVKVNIGLVGSFNQWGTSSSDIPLVQAVNNPDEWSLIYNFNNDEQVKFRQNNNWNLNWGNSDFPSGVATADGPNIPVPIGTYRINFNSNTGEYNFKTITIKCNEQDSLALVAIYSAAAGTNWSNKDNWLTGNVSSWHGVTLNQEGRVTKLNLTRNSLSGTLPNEIGNLTALTHLNLGNSRYTENNGAWNYLLRSTLPVSMSNLVNLEVLTLDGLRFQSELTDIFAGMSQLKELDLSYNYLTHESLPAGILNCINLELLNIAINYFSNLPNLTGLTKLRQLQTQSNRLTFEDLEPNVSISGFSYWPQAKFGIAEAFNPESGTLFSKTILVGGENNQYQWYKDDKVVNGQTSNTLVIANISNADAGIYNLRVTNTTVSQLTIYSEPIAIYQNQLPIYQALKDFYESTGGETWNNNTNWLSDAPISSWFGIYQNSDAKYTLQLNSNNLVGQLPENLGDLTLFYGIGIYDSPNLTGSIPSSIGDLSQLNWLYIQNTGLGGDIPSSLVNLTNLTSLDLEDNSFENLPDLSKLNLQGLYVYNNRLEFDDLAPTLKGNPDFWVEYAPQAKFGNYEIHSKSVGESLTLIVTVGGTGNLYQWFKDGNLLNGMTQNTLVLPSITISDYGKYECKVTNPDVPDLTLESKPIYLRTLADSSMYNALEAFFNSTGGQNWKDKTKWLTTEPISAWYGITIDESGLYSLNLENNNLSGQLPDNLGDLTEFKSIHIPNNPNLTGAIPESIGNLKKLGYLALYNNQLGGSIPSSIKSCVYLYSLYLYNNSLENMPDLTGKSLANLYIENNRFQFDDVANAMKAKASWFEYSPQAKFGEPMAYTTYGGQSLTLAAVVGGTGNVYVWYKDGNILDGETDNTLNFKLMTIENQGIYTCRVTNPDVPNLTMESEPMVVNIIRNELPIANAGPDQSVKGGDSAILDGSASSDPDNDALTYHWTAPAGIVLSSETEANPTFTAPEVSADTQYTFSLVVNDGKTDSQKDEVVITVLQANKVPIANAGADQTVNERETVSLNGSASTDSDSDALTYLWKSPDGITLSSATAANPTFIAPSILANTDLNFTLVVNDGHADSQEDQVVIHVSQIDLPPVAEAGFDQSVYEGDLVTLEGTTTSNQLVQLKVKKATIVQSESDSPDPDNCAINYQWVCPVDASLAKTTVTRLTFSGPELTTITDHLISLEISDGSASANLENALKFQWPIPAGVKLSPTIIAQITIVTPKDPEEKKCTFSLIVFDGSVSSIPNLNTPVYVSIPATEIPLISNTVVKLSVTSPETTEPVNYNYSMLVYDGSGSSDPNNGAIVYLSIPPTPIKLDSPTIGKLTIAVPQDQANPNYEFSLVVCPGTELTDPDEGKLTYHWTAPEGITLSSETGSITTFIAPEVDVDTDFTFALVVDNGKADSEADEVIVTVKNKNQIPIAHAGSDQSVNEGVTISLTGTASHDPDGDALSYKWTAPSGIKLSSETVAKPTFTAPEVSTDKQYTFLLEVNDGQTDSAPDEVVITVLQVNKVPIVDAGSDQSIYEGATGSLAGTASYDPDGDALSYKWTAPSGIKLSSETDARPTFTAPEVTQDKAYIFTLEVNDGQTDSAPDEVVIKVLQVNKVPIADAGAGQSIYEGAIGSLDGTASYDPDADALSYKWTAPSGIKLNSETDAKPTFTAPEVTQDKAYVFTLEVNDGATNSALSEVTITVKDIETTLDLVSKIDNVVIPPSMVAYQLYLKIDGSYILQDINSIEKDNLTSCSVSQGEWIVLASPVQNSFDFIPTYAGDVISWTEAEHIIVSDKSKNIIEINCIKPENSENGIAEISGFVYEDVDSGTKSMSITKTTMNTGNPVEGALIQLFKKGGTNPIATVVTDSNGFYKFVQLGISEYGIIVEIPGLIQSEQFSVIVSTQDPSISVKFIVNTFTGIITDINPILESLVKIYPNPTKGKVQLIFNQLPDAGTWISIYDNQGRLILKLAADDMEKIINLEGNSAGLYFIKIDQKGMKTYKLVME